MDNEQALMRAHRAFNELEEVNSAFDKVRDVLIKELLGSQIGQDAKILRLHAAIDALSAVRQVLQATIDNGRVAEAVAAAGLNRPN